MTAISHIQVVRSALYVVAIGGNDYLQTFEKLLGKAGTHDGRVPASVSAGLRHLVDYVVGNITDAVKVSTVCLDFLWVRRCSLTLPASAGHRSKCKQE